MTTQPKSSPTKKIVAGAIIALTLIGGAVGVTKLSTAAASTQTQAASTPSPAAATSSSASTTTTYQSARSTVS